MKMLRGRPYSFNQLTQFTMLNKVLDLLTCYINGSLTREKVILPSLEKGYFAKKIMFFIV
jgi:hypothetical protein